MDIGTMFEKASRLKLRLAVPVGVISVEDLWDLPLTSAKKVNLDDIAKHLNRTLKDATEEVSFVTSSSGNSINDEVRLSFEIVKYVISVKVAERDAVELAAQRREKKQQIMALISHKENEQLAGKSLEELQDMVSAL